MRTLESRQRNSGGMKMTTHDVVQWKPVKGYENYYHVSNAGDVLNVARQRMLKPKLSKTGYFRVNLSVKGKARSFSVHRLVAIAFIENVNNAPTVNHINELKTDNRVCNLEWMTNAQQNTHGTRLERARMSTDYKARKIDHYAIAAKIDYSKINEAQMKAVKQLTLEGKIINIYKSISSAAREIGISSARICEVAKGRRKTANGYRWEYA